MQFAPARRRAGVRAMTDQITDSVGGYLMGMVILAFFNSVVATILHVVLRVCPTRCSWVCSPSRSRSSR